MNKNAQMELMSWFRRIELWGSRKLLSRLAQKRRKMMTIQITTRKGKMQKQQNELSLFLEWKTYFYITTLEVTLECMKDGGI